MRTIGVVGLGKLGLPLALVLAEAGHRVLVWDHNTDVRQAVHDRRLDQLPDEPHVAEMLQANQLVVTSPGLLAELAEIIFVIVPTPSLPTGAFDARAVHDVLESLTSTEHRRSGTVALVSTVSPGTCELLAVTAATHGFGFVYCPTMIALGTVVRDLRGADLQIIGHHPGDQAESAAHQVADVLHGIAPETVQQLMSLESAEITKLASNTFSTLKIAFANVLGQLCDQYPGADVDHVVNALSYRGHIGRELLTAGAGFGGPCLPRDTHAFAAAGNGWTELGEYVHELNLAHRRYVVSTVVQEYRDRCGRPLATFAVLGRSYKDGSNYRIESFGDQLVESLETTYGRRSVAARDADAVIIAMPLRGVDLCDKISFGTLVYDLWRTHGYLARCEGVHYVPFGVYP